MCGIVGYIGKNNIATDFVMKGLHSLEYRGYDSAGMVTLIDGKPKLIKQVGRVENLRSIVENELGTQVLHLDAVQGSQEERVSRTSGTVNERLTQADTAMRQEHQRDMGSAHKQDGAVQNLCIGHTRWATHGAPTVQNAHPHFNADETIFVVHNGIIENHQELREFLQSKGYKFITETDTEIIPHLIDHYLKETKSFAPAFEKAIKDLRGAYAIASLYAKEAESVYVARLSSPLVIGVGDGEHFLASDATALLDKTKKVIYLDDFETARITKEKVAIHNIRKAVEVQRESEELDYDAEKSQLGDYPHFMLKEIYEAPQTIQSATRGRVKVWGGSGLGVSQLDAAADLSLSSGASRTDGTVSEQRKRKSAEAPEYNGGDSGSAREQAEVMRKSYTVKLGGLEDVSEQLRYIDRIVIVACGTSYYAGLVGEYLIEEIAGVPVEVQLASEFKYRHEPFSRSTALLAISQSGETADTIAAIKKVENYGVLKLGIVNATGSTIARITDAGVYCHAGLEQSVASTKAFIAQVTVLAEIALHLSQGRTPLYKPLLEELSILPEKAKQVLDNTEDIQRLAKKYSHYRDFLFIGRNYLFPCALEGALKLKEISYIHAEGYSAGEMKHGPLAMIDGHFPTFALATDSTLMEKTLSNIEEIRARKGPVLAIATEGNKQVPKLTKDVLFVPKTLPQLQPLLVCIVLQLFAYYVAVEKGLNVDRPRNLAKSVTVE